MGVMWVAPKGTSYKNTEEFVAQSMFAFVWGHFIVRYNTQEWYDEFVKTWEEWSRGRKEKNNRAHLYKKLGE